jgi:hypothetical protein
MSGIAAIHDTLCHVNSSPSEIGLIVYLPNWGCVSAVDCERRAIWIVDAHRDDGKRFVVRADELRTAFVELEAAIGAATQIP